MMAAAMILTMAASAMAHKNTVYVHDTVYIAKAVVKEAVEAPTPKADSTEKNNWGAKLKESNFHLGLDIQTKYIWRGMEMMTTDAAPVMFPSINYQWGGLFVYAMGGYSFNGKYAEVDIGASYTWNGLTVGFNDYYYPTVDGAEDSYFKGGKHTGHWLEACVTYAPEKVPVWLTVSNFFYGADKYQDANNEEKQAYSTYFELGTYYDFSKSNRISACVGMTPTRSCYNGYDKKFSVCNVDVKYTYNVNFKNGWTLPLSVEYIYNPVYDKSHINLIANFAF